MFTRRQFLTHTLRGSSLVALSAVVPQFVARTARAAAPGKDTILVVVEMTGGNDSAFTVRLKEPFPLLLDGLAKRSSLVPFIMPERTAKTGPFRQITDTVGSCPFKFVREEFEPGHRAV